MKLPAIPFAGRRRAAGSSADVLQSGRYRKRAIGDKVINNVFSIMNNGISLGIVPEDASPVILKTQ